MTEDPTDLSDAQLRRSMPEAFARFQQMQFLRLVFTRPEFQDVLRGAVIKYLRKTGEPHLREAAAYIEREQLNVADAVAESGRGADPPRLHPRGAPGGRGEPPAHPDGA